jgi:hypothetical protein
MQEEEKVKHKVDAKKTKSFGNALKGKPGTSFLINDIKFVVLDEKDAKYNSMVLC